MSTKTLQARQAAEIAENEARTDEAHARSAEANAVEAEAHAREDAASRGTESDDVVVLMANP